MILHGPPGPTQDGPAANQNLLADLNPSSNESGNHRNPNTKIGDHDVEVTKQGRQDEGREGEKEGEENVEGNIVRNTWNKE